MFFYVLTRSLLLESDLQIGFMSEGEFDQSQVAFKLQLTADVGSVCLDCAMTDEQLTSYFLAGLIFGDELQYAALHRGERFKPGILLC